MRTIWIEDMGNGAFAISSEMHDGIVYKADSVEDAVKKYEADQDCVVGVVQSWGDIAVEEQKQLVLM